MPLQGPAHRTHRVLPFGNSECQKLSRGLAANGAKSAGSTICCARIPQQEVLLLLFKVILSAHGRGR
jgi:hypothetical protein